MQLTCPIQWAGGESRQVGRRGGRHVGRRGGRQAQPLCAAHRACAGSFGSRPWACQASSGAQMPPPPSTKTAAAYSSTHSTDNPQALTPATGNDVVCVCAAAPGNAVGGRQLPAALSLVKQVGCFQRLQEERCTQVESSCRVPSWGGASLIVFCASQKQVGCSQRLREEQVGWRQQ